MTMSPMPTLSHHARKARRFAAFEHAGFAKNAMPLNMLKSLEKLQKLRLDGTKVTDQGLVHIMRMSGLEEIWLHETKTSRAGVEHLKSMLPRLKVFR